VHDLPIIRPLRPDEEARLAARPDAKWVDTATAATIQASIAWRCRRDGTYGPAKVSADMAGSDLECDRTVRRPGFGRRTAGNVSGGRT